jgi:hypothetical protein
MDSTKIIKKGLTWISAQFTPDIRHHQNGGGGKAPPTKENL